ncbi:MAG: heme-binding domain-containing protein [Planctomycetes bacterium]|nr:heme-binding domain-containing protein [Planctomycetota bacterium]MCB9918321.1 heme-binding domain-containing protein [Planctomycetota bacterium]
MAVSKSFRRFGLVLLLVVIGIQFVPTDRSNPPVTRDVDANAEVEAILRRACYDCHSNQVRWPWYSYVAPVSWWVAHDVEEGRSHLNFSTWDRYDEDRLQRLKNEIMDEVREGHMPPRNYVWMHGEADLSEDDIRAIVAWAKS